MYKKIKEHRRDHRTRPKGEVMNMYRIKCGEILGGNSNQVADACSANLMTSLFSSACNSNNGGDIYYVSVCDSDILTRIAIADVAGHGRHVSHISMGIYRALKTHMNSLEGDEVLSSTNRYASKQGVTAMTTASIIGYYADHKALYYTYAGHHPLLVNKAGTTRWIPARGDYLPDQGSINIPLAVLPDAQYLQFKLPMDIGDRALLYTYGVTELRNEHGVEFGIEKLLRALDKYNHLPLHDLKERLARELHAYSNGKLDHDDVTFIFTEVTEKLPCHSQEAA
jgi:serine phosphatase RsbU (regulator of sigma subunit)